jgi:hypothetical protein
MNDSRKCCTPLTPTPQAGAPGCRATPTAASRSASGHARMGDSDNLRTNDVASFGPFRLFMAATLFGRRGIQGGYHD